MQHPSSPVRRAAILGCAGLASAHPILWHLHLQSAANSVMIVSLVVLGAGEILLERLQARAQVRLFYRSGCVLLAVCSIGIQTPLWSTWLDVVLRFLGVALCALALRWWSTDGDMDTPRIAGYEDEHP